MTKDLGNIDNTILVFGGVYSNLQALERLIEIAENLDIPYHHIICTGDIAGYFAQPEECYQLIKNLGIQSILGNVEIQLKKEADDCGCNFGVGSLCDCYSKIWYPYTQSKVSEKTVVWLTTLPKYIYFTFHGKRFCVVHGSYSKVSQFIFKSTDWIVKESEIQLAKTDIILAGHSGIPFIDLKAGKGWVNAGVIGMPANNGSTNVYYLTIQVKNGAIHFEHHSFAYDYKKAINLMNEAKLPQQYALTLETGIWDNCDILPEKETEDQGKYLKLTPEILN